MDQIVDADKGLGTTYERWALNRMLGRLWETYQFQSVFEGPGDGVAGISGINSLILAKNNIPVTIMLENEQKVSMAKKVWELYAPNSGAIFKSGQIGPGIPFSDSSFELVWNFNVINRNPKAEIIANEMCRISSKFVLICVPNRHNYSFGLQRLQYRVGKREWDRGEKNLLEAKPWVRLLQKNGLQIREIFYVHCPWWPDIINPDQFILDFFPFLKSLAQKAKPENRRHWPFDHLPYYDPEKNKDLFKEMENLAWFENTRMIWLQRLFAHHVCILAEKRDRS